MELWTTLFSSVIILDLFILLHLIDCPDRYNMKISLIEGEAVDQFWDLAWKLSDKIFVHRVDQQPSWLLCRADHHQPYKAYIQCHMTGPVHCTGCTRRWNMTISDYRWQMTVHNHMPDSCIQLGYGCMDKYRYITTTIDTCTMPIRSESNQIKHHKQKI